ncbi:MAG: EamA family transporter RarD [Candidatus Marinimicrobia bacterium]|nr:EamA family transporter RarD [Candidatus Neomarinimicrobiota bacterium]
MTDSVKGTLSTTAAFLIWGTIPIYWKFLQSLPSPHVMAHRVIWSLVFVFIMLFIQQRWSEVKVALTSMKVRFTLILTALLIGTNWLVYIWAVTNNHIVEASLGYFINPLINMLLGVIFLKERLHRWQILSVILAVIGVVFLTIQFHRLPWIALTLAFSFGFYGLLRKTANVKSVPGLCVELMVLFPLAGAYLFWFTDAPGFFGSTQGSIYALLLGTGVITAIPMLLFAHGAKRIQYITVGFIQYLAPTGQLLSGVLLFDEPFTQSHLVAFAFIWSALIIYTITAVYQFKRLKLKSNFVSE